MTMTFSPRALEAATEAYVKSRCGGSLPEYCMRDALSAAMAVDGVALQSWQDISTAPKDGTWILGWSDPDKSPYRISWGRNHRNELTWCTNFSSFIEGYITHWQPLPAAPAASDGGERR
jgi:hypothetical protein